MNMQELTVADLMHSDARTVAETLSLPEVTRLMHEWGVSSLVVEKAGPNDALGIITRRDIVEALSAPGIEALCVRDVMTKPAIIVPPELAVHHCIRLMRMTGVRRVPVVKDERLVGILSNSDVFRCYARSIGSDASSD